MRYVMYRMNRKTEKLYLEFLVEYIKSACEDLHLRLYIEECPHKCQELQEIIQKCPDTTGKYSDHELE